jgi:hypothetical protein
MSQIFLEVGRDRPRSSGLRPSIELAHGFRTADISARARPLDREAPGFENQRRCPRRCAADAQVRTVRHSFEHSSSTLEEGHGDSGVVVIAAFADSPTLVPPSHSYVRVQQRLTPWD